MSDLPTSGNVHLDAGNRRDELTAIVALLRGNGGSNPALGARIERTGSAVELLLSQSSSQASLLDPSSGDRSAVDDARSTVDDWLDRRLDVRTVLDPGYPYALRDVYDRPPLVFLRGNWIEGRDGWSVAVVGTRRASDAGLKRAQRLSRELSDAGYPVISGLAVGIDSSAHGAALDANGTTHAVMGTGLDHVFPAENRHLAERIVDAGGCLLTQFFPHQGPARWTFPLRNRVMSGLTMATVVVEGGETSGSKIQAERALVHGRPVFLMRSLVDNHAWAREMVETGHGGTRAEILGSPEELLDRLSGRAFDQLALAL